MRPRAGATRSSSRCRAGWSGRRCAATARRSATYLEDAKLGHPGAGGGAHRGARGHGCAARLNHADDDAVRADLARLPALLDHVDELLAHGVIGGAEPQRRRLPDRHERPAPADARRHARR